MLDFRQVSVSHGGRAVLDAVSFRVHARERVGIVGPNGAGKTTVFELIAGEIQPDRGEIQVPRDARLGYLRQQFQPADPALSALDFAEDAVPAVRRMQHEIEEIEGRLSAEGGEAHDRDLRRLGELQTGFEHLGGYELRSRASAALCGLGFRAGELHRPLREFSGGWQMRAELVRALIARPGLLLLDEPTNYLDLPAVEWLQRYLRDFAGTLLLISHDRFLLNTLTTVTLEVLGGRVTRYEGNHAYYAEERRRRFEQADATRAAQARRREEIERFVDRFRFNAGRASQVQSRIKMLERMEPVEKVALAARAAHIRIPAPPPCGAEVLRLESAGLAYDGEHWVLRGIDLAVRRGDKTALVGFNGLGKTTLLRMLGGLAPLNEGVRRVGRHVVIGYQSQEFAEVLDPERTVLETLKAAGADLGERELRSMLGGFLFSGDDVEKRVGVLSGGEKMRLALARLLVNPPNFLLLDEPTTHLDIAAREALERALTEYRGTLYLVSHDIEFVRRVVTTVIAMTPPGITPYAGGYDYYREKAALDAAGPGGSPEARGAAPAPAGAQDPRRTQRRERALRREERRQLRAPLLKIVRAAEERIAALEREETALVARFQHPEGLDFAASNRRMAEIREELPRLMADWEHASLELQAIDAQPTDV